MYNSYDLAISIKSVAKEKNIIIKDMLESCELGSNTMSSLYHGKSIAFDSVAKIADYLGVSVDYLLGRTDTPDPSVKNSIVIGHDNSGTATVNSGMPSSTNAIVEIETIISRLTGASRYRAIAEVLEVLEKYT